MKNIFLIILLSFSVGLAAEEKGRQLLFGGEMHVGVFGSPTLKLTNIKGKSKVLIGGQGAILINRQLYLGGGGGATVKDVGDGFASYSYGGVYLGSFIYPNKAIHYFFDIGLYAANMSSGGRKTNSSQATNHEAENFYFFDPNIGVAVNLMKNVKLMLGVSYKIAGAVDRPDISSSDVGGYSINGSIVFGTF